MMTGIEFRVIDACNPYAFPVFIIMFIKPACIENPEFKAITAENVCYNTIYPVLHLVSPIRLMAFLCVYPI